MKQKNKHLQYQDRVVIEALLSKKQSKADIAKYVGCSLSTLYNELKRGSYCRKRSDLTEFVAYSADVAQKDYNYKQTSKGADLKLGSDYRFIKYVTLAVKYGYSPKAVIMRIKNKHLKFKTNICFKTLYNYIHNGLFLNVKMSDLPRKGKIKRKISHVKHTLVKNILYPRIHNRPKEVNNRSSFGHWEIDSVIGQRDKKPCLLVLTERLTRFELIFKVRNKSQFETNRILNKLERRFGAKYFRHVFKSFTADNGSEFDPLSITKSCINKHKKRCEVWFCHPYCSWERGSNENQNTFIRRFIPKGTDISEYSTDYIYKVQRFINRYPREILGGKSSEELFNIHINNIMNL